MRKMVMSVLAMMLCPAPIFGQAGQSELIEIPLRVEGGRLVVTAQDPQGVEYHFVLGLGMALLTESGAARIGDSMSSLTIGGVPVDTEGAQTVPDAYLGDVDVVGVLGGLTLNGYDILIDPPNDRLVLKPVGRSVRWDEVSLSNPVNLTIFHGVLMRADVEAGGKLVGGLIDLANPGLEVNEPLSFAVHGGRLESFRMGYANWPDLPVDIVDSPIFQGWDADGNGFVVIGAAISYDCAIAISWIHAELRTCVR